MQYIFVRELKVETVIGVHDDERVRSQMLTFDIEVGIPDRRAFASDRLTDTVDYAKVAALVRRELAGHSFTLLERLAQHLNDCIEREFQTTWIRLSIAKSAIVTGASQVGVVIETGARPGGRA